MDWRRVDYLRIIVIFKKKIISCLDSHSDGTHSLQRIHWWASDVKLGFSKSVSMRKPPHLPYILDDLRVSTFSANFHFWVNYSFNLKKSAYTMWKDRLLEYIWILVVPTYILLTWSNFASTCQFILTLTLTLT